ncbi:MAG: RbsD/FucU family protein [Gemmataceae bacterium]
MLNYQLIHPQISGILASAGHHAGILIADGNYPASTKKGPNAQVVSLNLMPGIVTCNQVLQAVLSAIPIDAIYTMTPETEGPYALDNDPPVWAEYRQTITDAGLDLELLQIEKWEYYDTVMTPDHVLTVQTADQQIFANLYLSVGVRMD